MKTILREGIYYGLFQGFAAFLVSIGRIPLRQVLYVTGAVMFTASTLAITFAAAHEQNTSKPKQHNLPRLYASEIQRPKTIAIKTNNGKVFIRLPDWITEKQLNKLIELAQQNKPLTYNALCPPFTRHKNNVPTEGTAFLLRTWLLDNNYAYTDTNNRVVLNRAGRHNIIRWSTGHRSWSPLPQHLQIKKPGQFPRI